MTQLDDKPVMPVAAGEPRRLDVRSLMQTRPWLPALVTSVVLLVVGQIVSPGFASWGSLNQILAASAILAIVSCGQSIVMISGDFGIDLSVGQVMSLAAIAGYMSMKGGSNALVAVAVVVVIAVGGILGGLSGILVSVIRLPALVVTLGTLVVATGLELVLASKGTPDGSVPPLLNVLTTSSVLGVKWVTFLAVVVVVGMFFLTRRSRFGRMLFFVGSNREAARLSGLPVRRIVFVTYVLAGICSGLSGLLLLSYAGQANLDLGSGYLVLSIAATVIGGTSLAGGEGSVVGAATGAIAFMVTNTLMLTLGVSDAVRQSVVGVLLMVLLAFNVRTPKLRQ